MQPQSTHRLITLSGSLLAVLMLSGCGTTGDLDKEYRARFWEKYQSDGDSAARDARLDAAKTFFTSAVGEAQSLGTSDFRLAISLDRLASVCIAQGNDTEAQTHLERAVNVYESSTTPKDALTKKEMVRTYRALAELFLKQKHFKEAVGFYTKAVGVYRDSLSKGTFRSSDWLLNEDYAKSLYGLAVAYDALNENGFAEKHYESSLQVAQENHLSKSFVETVQSNYAKFLRRTNRKDQASRIEALLNQSAEEHEQTEILRQWTELHDASYSEAQKGRLQEAEALARQAMQVARKFGDSNIHVLISLNDLMRVLIKERKYQDVYDLGSEAEGIASASPDSKELDNLLGTIGRLHDHKGELSQTAAVYEQRLKLRKRLRGADNEHVAEALKDLANVYLKQGKKAIAEQSVDEAISILKKSSEDKSKEIAECERLQREIRALNEIPP